MGTGSKEQHIIPQEQVDQLLKEERQLFIGGPTVIFKWRAGPEGIVEYVSPNVLLQFGYTPQQFTSGDLRYAAIVHPDDLSRVVAEIEAYSEAGQPHFEQEYRIRRADGRYRWLYDFTVVVYDQAGLPQHLLGYVQDITDRKEAEKTLRASEEKYRVIVETAQEGIWMIDAAGKTSFVNQRMADMLGYSRAEMDGRHLFDFMSAESLVQAEHYLERRLQGITEQHDFRFKHKDGRDVWAIVSTNPLRNEAGEYIGGLAMLVEITSRKQMETKLQLQNAALEATANAILITNHKGLIVWANPAFTRLAGYTLAEVEGKKTSVLRSGVHDEAFYQTMWQTILSGQVWHGRLTNKRRDGRLYTEEQTITPVHNERGQITHFIAIKQDVTEQEQAAEIRLEQERLKASLKKEQEFNLLVRQTVSALSHDVRTPLTVISTAKDMLIHYNDQLDEAKRREKLSLIEKQLRYVLDMLDDMMLVVQGSLTAAPLKPVPVNLPALCQVSLDEIQETIGVKHRLLFIPDDVTVQTAQLDETLVSRILINLLSNAVKFSPEGSEIWLQLGRRDHWISLRVTDHGLGIAEADQPHIFDAFYRADDVQEIEGAGLGLSIVKECVNRHQGRIHLESQPGQGTTFTVELPAETPLL
jgi:PAS domain S-box-containing protein